MQYHLPASLTSQVVQENFLANPLRTTESHYVWFSFHWQIKWSKLMWPKWPEEWSTKRNWAILPTKLDTSQLFSAMDSLQSPVSRKTTFPSTISSTRISFTKQLPPIRNRRELPLIPKQGDVIVPWGTSLWFAPTWWEGLGRFSKPPIHQFLLWFAGPLPLSNELSPYVGWLLNALPVNVQPDNPFSKSNRVPQCAENK